MTAALRAAPHLAACANYADTAPEKPLRLIFCAEHLPTAIQAAACLSACHGADEERSGQKDDVWDDLDAYLDLGENENAKDPSDLLVLADAAMLDPACADAESPLHIQLLMQKQAVLRNVWQQANALLLYSDDDLPSQALLDFLAVAPQKSLFLAVRKRQFNRALLNQLCFEQGFRVCRLGILLRSPRPQLRCKHRIKDRSMQICRAGVSRRFLTDSLKNIRTASSGPMHMTAYPFT